jgi:hypothetical protein
MAGPNCQRASLTAEHPSAVGSPQHILSLEVPGVPWVGQGREQGYSRRLQWSAHTTRKDKNTEERGWGGAPPASAVPYLCAMGGF